MDDTMEDLAELILTTMLAPYYVGMHLIIMPWLVVLPDP